MENKEKKQQELNDEELKQVSGGLLPNGVRVKDNAIKRIVIKK